VRTINKKIAGIVVIVAIIISAVIGVFFCLSQPTENSDEESKDWRQVTTFNGVEGKTLPVFTVRSSEWRIRYSWEGGESVWFSFVVYPEGETVMYVEMVMADKSSGEDVTYIYSGAGGYYIQVVAANLDGWSLTVEDYR